MSKLLYLYTEINIMINELYILCHDTARSTCQQRGVVYTFRRKQLICVPAAAGRMRTVDMTTDFVLCIYFYQHCGGRCSGRVAIFFAQQAIVISLFANYSPFTLCRALRHMLLVVGRDRLNFDRLSCLLPIVYRAIPSVHVLCSPMHSKKRRV